MKARVNVTGVIVDVIHSHNITSGGIVMKKIYQDQLGNEYSDSELEFLQEEQYTPDYWTRLEHQAAIGAMGGICGNTSYNESSWEAIAEDAIRAAHTFIQKLKEKEEKEEK